jgi:hypothetical protein
LIVLSLDIIVLTVCGLIPEIVIYSYVLDILSNTILM